ncbi:glutathione synthetase-like isoform X1 [Diorhabda carinulata]|uniref:glutathione synthetase-like isoform X1 n=2 Tax=Diorhabda carinulata TaxID=1163345 RepID=UPI0025A20070|nr:glutathione synthetase-like isoform X1 [Diorhabda carinulata]XP_057663386.1 glutathione synthetase-like isoform X1 [Diorhabda carinulata]XP_057663388.1 glutathione synthetase-like isoform X1 [Diorhabda carinulata]
MSGKIRMPASIPVPIEVNNLREIVAKAKDWAVVHGISMRSKTNFSEDMVQISPFILFPTGIPRKEFNKVVELQTTLNELLHNIAHNKEFLKSCFKNVIEADPFTAKLYEIYETIEKEGCNQKISMLHLRSDYLMQSSSNNVLKQVEFNTIAASFGSFSTILTEYNRYILQELGYHDNIKNLPQNNGLRNLAQGFIQAWRLYNNEDAAILFLTLDVTYNISDQRWIEFEIKRLSPRTKVVRKTFNDIYKRGQLNNKHELVIDNTIISVIYFREGYVPDHYPTNCEWDARLMMERSTAIKCPDIKFHLVGQKKVQQELTKPGVLELFLTETAKIEAVREAFVNIHGLEFDENGDKAVQMALSNPKMYVLKPQREGGGNNYYDNDVKEMMLKMKDCKDRSGYILMERIFPPLSMGYMISAGGPNPPPLIDIVSELGIYGILISESGNIIMNKQTGHLIRSKSPKSNEGGILAGSGALDCPYLLD